MKKKEIIKELREILKVYHYESEEQHISKDVVTSLENLLGSLLNPHNNLPEEILVKTWELE